METKSLEDRVALLENELRELPERVSSVEARLSLVEVRLTSVEAQFVQFRVEVRDEFSATREDLRREIRDVDKALHTRIDELGVEMRMLFENAIDRIKIIKHG